MLKKIGLGALGVVVLALVGGGCVLYSQARAFDAAAAKVWDVPLANVKAPDLTAAAAYVAAHGDAPAEEGALAADVVTYKRGAHLARSVGGCMSCHGADLGTPEVIELGPVGTVIPANITKGGKLKEYSDAELHRLLVNGVKRDGTSVLFMNPEEFRWWPDEDLMALVGYLRTVPAIEKQPAPSTIGALGKTLDRADKLPLMVAERTVGKARSIAGAPEATAQYGASLTALCKGCHGDGMSGGQIPGTPPSIPIPKNITKHATGIAHYDFEKFDTLMRTGKKPDGTTLDPFMPIGAFKHFSELEMRAIWAYLQSVEPKPFGGR